MPMYEYVCVACGTEFDEFARSMDAVEPISCPSCGSKRTERKLSVFAAPHSASPSQSFGGCGRCGDANGPCARSMGG